MSAEAANFVMLRWLLGNYLCRQTKASPNAAMKMVVASKMPVVLDAVEMYNRSADPDERNQILSTLVGTFNRHKLNALGFTGTISKYAYCMAQHHAAAFGPGRSKWEHLKTIRRTKLNARDFEEVLETVCSPEHIQDLAFGSKELRLSSGKAIDIPAVQRKVCTS